MLTQSPQLIIFTTLAVILAAIVALFKHFFSYWKKRGVNYLEPIIPFGTVASAVFGRSSFGETFRDSYREMRDRGWKHGGIYLMGKPIYMPLDNDLIKKVLVSDFLHFPNRGFYISEKVDPLSAHIFHMENYKWKNLRSKLPVAFTAMKMREYVVIMERIANVLTEKLDRYAKSKEPVNLKDILSRFATDIIASCALGMESDTLNNKNESLMEQGRYFFDNQFSRSTIVTFLLVPRAILTSLNYKLFSKSPTNYFMKMFKDVREYREKETVKRNDLTDILLGLCDETKVHRDFNGKGTMEPLNFDEFTAQIYSFFEAGFETSSSTQAFGMYELAINPEIQEKLRLEINTVLERHNGQVTYDSVNEMEYLDRFVDETLRKYPVLPIIPRSCTEDYKVPGTDVTIEKGTFVVVSNFGIHYDPEYYPDPMKFDPDRFLPENKAKRPFCSYLPFGEGPRICIGKRFGLWQTKIGLVSMVKDYKITLSDKMKLPFTYDKAGLILKAKGDIWVNLEKI